MMLAPLTLGRAFTAWRAEPGVLVAVAALGGGYGWGLRRRTVGATGPWPAGRTAVFLAGVATILLVGCSFLGVYDDAYFWVRAVQNTVLLMVTPTLLALGAPIRLAADTLPARLRLARALHSRVARTLMFPLVVTVVLVVPLLVLYLSPLYVLTLESAVASGVACTVVALTGFVYYWSRFQLTTAPRLLPGHAVDHGRGDDRRRGAGRGALARAARRDGVVRGTGHRRRPAPRPDPRRGRPLDRRRPRRAAVHPPRRQPHEPRGHPQGRGDRRRAGRRRAHRAVAGVPTAARRALPPPLVRRPTATAGWCGRARAPGSGRRKGRRTASWRRRRGSRWWP